MPYLDKTGLTELWSNIKNKFAHSYSLDVNSTDGARIKLMSGDGTTLTNNAIPVATPTQTGLMTGDQAENVEKIKNLATVATTGSYSDLTGTPTIDTSMSSTSTNAVTNAAISSALSGKANTSHTHTKSQITDFPTSLKNPNALTIGGVTYDGSAAKSITSIKNPNPLYIYAGYNPNSSADTVEYDGSAAETIWTMYGGVVIQQSWDYDDITTALDNSQTPVLKAYYSNAANEPTWVYLLCNGLHESQSDTDTTFYMFNGMDWYGHIYIATCEQNGSVDSINKGVVIPLDVDLAAVTYLRQDTASSTYAKLANPTFTGTPKAPTAAAGTNTEQIATTAFVKTAIDASGAGVVHYKGAAASTDDLKNYVKGDYWVASAEFSYTGTDSKTVYIEKGDMLFANDTASTFAAAYFDVVQANITAMTTAEVDAICTLN
jgi:hypothetical protein